MKLTLLVPRAMYYSRNGHHLNVFCFSRWQCKEPNVSLCIPRWSLLTTPWSASRFTYSVYNHWEAGVLRILCNRFDMAPRKLNMNLFLFLTPRSFVTSIFVFFMQVAHSIIAPRGQTYLEHHQDPSRGTFWIKPYSRANLGFISIIIWP